MGRHQFFNGTYKNRLFSTTWLKKIALERLQEIDVANWFFVEEEDSHNPGVEIDRIGMFKK